MLLAFSFNVNSRGCALTKGQIADIHIDMLATVIEVHKSYHGRYLTQQEGLAGLIVYADDGSHKINREESYIRKEVPLDPWGYPYQYRYPGIKNPSGYDLWSNGADGVAGGEDANKDCGNWPGGNCLEEASVYEEALTTFKIYAFTFILAISPVFCLVFYVARVLLLKFKGAPWSKARQGIHARLMRYSLLSFLVTFACLLISPGFLMSC